MSNPHQDLAMLGAMFRWLSDVFYYIPTEERLSFTKENIDLWPDAETSLLIPAILTSIEHDGLEIIERDFYRMFIGPGKKEVYPWGSVYTDNENLLFGDTTVAWEKFCQQHSIQITPTMNEPTDHFALIFSALAAVLDSDLPETQKIAVAQQIYHDHFSAWGDELLQQVVAKANTEYYKTFAILSQHSIATLTKL